MKKIYINNHKYEVFNFYYAKHLNSVKKNLKQYLKLTLTF